MGCISSKMLLRTESNQGLLYYDSDSAVRCPTHIVSLTSSTYGALDLDRHEAEDKNPEEVPKKVIEWKRPTPHLTLPIFKKCTEEPPEIINAWELMKDLGEDTPIWSPLKKPFKKEMMKSPKTQKMKSAGKENSPLGQTPGRAVSDPSRLLRPFSSLENSKSQRRLAPVLDSVASSKQECNEQKDQIKNMVVTSVPRNRKPRESTVLLQSFVEKCPPGGENAVVLYTTTLRGIRKTFEDCNSVRSVIEAFDVQFVERDISMDLGFREELRVLLGRREVRVPLLFVKGRLVGGAEEVLKLDEEGKLGLLMEGIPVASVWCEGCAGVRFVMCADCSGSCKVLDEEQKKMVKCGECNENGLIHCPICS